MSLSPLHGFAFIAALALIATPSLACERHKEHTASVMASVLPPPAPAESALSTPLLVSPAAAAMSVSEALGAEPYDMRCPRLRKFEQALTQ
jgi:hypothetical protein